MDALRGAFAAGLLPWPQTRTRLALLLAASIAAHLGAAGSLTRLMSGVSPGRSATASSVIRASLVQAPSLATVGTSSSTSSNGSPNPMAAHALAPPATVPTRQDTAVSSATAPAGPVAAPPPVARPPAREPLPDPKPRQGSELAARDADGPLPGPRYLHLKEVDQRPAPITRIEPVYPPEAGQVEGRVVVRLLINENGGIDRIEIVSAEPAGWFERPTLEAFGNARYQAALKSNVRVKSQLTFEVKFAREDAPPSPDRLPAAVPTGPARAGG